MTNAALVADRLAWIEREAQACDRVGATRLARWWRDEYLRVMAAAA